MNHKATATCKNGHTFEFGSCTGEKKRLLGGTKPCGSKGFEQIYDDGSTLTVSFGDRPVIAVKCVGCKTVFEIRSCPSCGDEVPVRSFRKDGLAARLG